MAKPCAPMFGGFNRYWSFSAYPLSSSIPPGLRFRARIISSAIISRRFIRPNCLAIRPIVGLDRNQVGGRSGFYFRPRCLFFGHRVAFGLPVIIIVALTTKRSGLILQRALWESRARPTGASGLSRSSCKMCIAIFSIWHS